VTDPQSTIGPVPETFRAIAATVVPEAAKQVPDALRASLRIRLPVEPTACEELT
jgi:hypothetical protein